MITRAQKHPAGCMVFTGGAAPPPRALACDGSQVAQAAYPNLYAAIGDTFANGQVPAAGNFFLPDHRGRSPIGQGQGAGLGNNYARGQYYGEETHALATGELAAHNHGVNDPGHAHGISDPGHAHNIIGKLSTTGSGYASLAANTATGPLTTANTTGVTVNSGATGVTTQNTGSGSGHNTVHPVLAALWAIYY